MLSRFWSFIRARQARALAIQARVLRRALGKGTRIVRNEHDLPLLDLAAVGDAYDAVAMSARPMLLADEVLMRHYIAYHTQLAADLSGKPPMVGVRVNQVAAGSGSFPPQTSFAIGTTRRSGMARAASTFGRMIFPRTDRFTRMMDRFPATRISPRFPSSAGKPRCKFSASWQVGRGSACRRQRWPF